MLTLALPGPATATEEASPQIEVLLKIGSEPVRELTTPAVPVAQLLADQAVVVDRDDEVLLLREGDLHFGAADEQLAAGDTVRVVRFDVQLRTKRVKVASRTMTRTVTHLPPGKRKVVQRGRTGVRKVTVEKTFRNDRLVDTDVSKQLVRKPKPRRVLVGKRYPTVPGTGGLHWKALAGCESGGRPGAVNAAGYYGLYQFNVGTWRSVGGRGMPHHAFPAEQTYRAQRLYAARGRSPWPVCGRLL